MVSTGSGVEYRPDIQGMRALAVLLVALAHAHVGPFEAGFIGVDVFFVISGFLITQLLLAEAQRTGRISVAGFYARRARRILPAATVVVVATVVVGALTLSRVDAVNVTSDAIWATLFLANVKFGRDGTDYFAEGAPPSLLQHYWSLSIEEQFYLAWPLLVVAMVWWAARRTTGEERRALHRSAVAVLTVIVGVSFAWSVLLTEASPVAAYFATPARVWELGVGALAAVLLPLAGRVSVAARSVAGWVGLAAILWSAVAIAETEFPGWIAAVPVIGTAMLLLAGRETVPGSPQRLLSLRPLRVVGDWSYSFYLWHWPALVIVDRLGGDARGLNGAVVLVAALGLSGLTYRFVETPFRRGVLRASRPPRHRHGLVLYPVTVTLTIGLALGSAATIRSVAGGGLPITTERYGQDAGDLEPEFSTNDFVALVEASVAAARNDYPVPRDLQPDLLDLKASVPDLGECSYRRWPNEKLCRRGDTGAERTVVVIGDSHARAWIPAFEAAAEAHGWAAYYLVKEGCTGAEVTPWAHRRGKPADGCLDFRAWAAQQVEELRPDLVVLASDAPTRVLVADGTVTHSNDVVADEMERGYVATANSLRRHTERLVIVGDVPGLVDKPDLCLSERDATLLGCASELSVLRGHLMNRATARAAQHLGVPFVDPTPWFCADDLCPAVVGSFVTMRDREHITVAYAEHLAGPFGRALGMHR